MPETTPIFPIPARWSSYAFVTGGVLALLAVALGAFGAHALESRLSASSLETFETAVRYQMYHAIAILITALCAGRYLTVKAANRTALFFACGVLLFSGSLYAYIGAGMRAFAFITPAGGLLFILGWISLILGAVFSSQKRVFDSTIE